MNRADIAIIGLGVMGKSLALNLVDNGYHVAGYDLQTYNRTRAEEEAKAVGESGGSQFTAVSSLSELLATLAMPRIIALSVPAGSIVDQVVEDLLNVGLSRDDIVIDTGNSLWTDSERREKTWQGKLRFFSTAVSGGEVGARFGPSLMASGAPEAWHHIEPIWRSIAAKVDAKGQALPATAKGEACAAYLGPAGAGHYVKMVHNGIEYADMQLICEAYHLMKAVLKMSCREIGKQFQLWNQGVLGSYLMEISADILQTDDPVTGKPFVDVVLDKAGQKGTGLWTAVDSLQQGAATPSIAAAVFARAQSSNKELRIRASKHINAPELSNLALEKDLVLESLHDALYCAKLSVYAQGFDLMATTSRQQGWQLNFEQIAKIWRAGCIIRAAFLQQISDAYKAQPDLEHLLLAEHFQSTLQKHQFGWRQTVACAALNGIPLPGISSTLSYVDSLRCEQLPANLLQAQRDYFGAHSYVRADEDSGQSYHLTWNEQPRQQLKLP